MIQILWSRKSHDVRVAFAWGLAGAVLLFSLAGCSLFSASSLGDVLDKPTIGGALDKPPPKAGLDMAECEAVAVQAIQQAGIGIHVAALRFQLAMEEAGLTESEAQRLMDFANSAAIKERATATYAGFALGQLNTLLLAVGCPAILE